MRDHSTLSASWDGPLSITPGRSSCADHASEREKLSITAAYYRNVTGELDKAAQTYQEQIENYPRKPAG